MSAKLGPSLKGISLSVPQMPRQYQIDSVIVLALAISIAIISYLGTYQIPDAVFTDFYAQDTWFGSDIPTVFGNMTSIQSDFGRNNKHPLFPLLVFPPIFIIGKLLHLEPIAAVRLVIPMVAAIWIGLLFALFRLMGCQRLDATLLSLVGGSSAAAVFWFTVPESFSFGSVTILMAFVLAAFTQHRRLSPFWYVAVSALTVSITITNWIAGLLATFVNHRWKKALQITAITFAIVNALWIVQRTIFRNSGYSFSLKTFIGEKKFIAGPETGGTTIGAIGSFFYQTIVMPTIQLSDSILRPGWPKMQVDTLAPGSGSIWGAIAAVSWTALLLLGIWGFFTTKQHPKLRIVLGGTFLLQLAMHSVYGTGETFIYALHFAPLLLTLAAFGCLTRLRLVALALAAVLAVSAGINNRAQFLQLTAALINYGTPQQQVQAHIKARPNDPWPRSAGHVVLATPGSQDTEKAYYEPAGSFSPSAGSFGVSIWMVDKDGALKTTSDTIPLAKIQQQFLYTPTQAVPGIVAKTEDYQATWSKTKPGLWQLNLQVPANSKARPVVVIRSVGPAGGAVNALKWDGQQLLINQRWSIGAKSAQVYLGRESAPGWTTQKSTETTVTDPQGWGVARLELGAGETWDINLADATPEPKSDLKVTGLTSTLALNLPDPQFLTSLNAQVSHLLMGLVGNRTRPSDPLDYTLPRSREGAYQLVALARAGQIEVAKQLSPYFAETDFLNGVAPEADIPALGIWALEAVALQVNQPEYDKWLWPHIQRKADLISTLLSTNKPGYPVLDQAKRPLAEYPDTIAVDYIGGKMEGMPGLISIDPTASLMSYRALRDAADLADRLKQSPAAQRWREQAAQIQAAWTKSFDQRFASIDATYTKGLWPSGIASAEPNRLVAGLQARWDGSRDAQGAYRQMPGEPFFNLAETHQWLYLGKPEQVLTTLKWFWANQASPGLYTWWGTTDKAGGTPMPKNLSQWRNFRGWVTPPHVTPHYWTTAEMLLLQLDMLGYMDPVASSPTLVIGAGIPQAWLNQPIGVKGLAIAGSVVNWNWDGKQLNVQIKGKKIAIKPGSAFPPNTPITVTALQASA